MKAAILHGKEDLRVEELAERPLAAGEVRLKIRAALTCGTDLKVYRRGYHARMIVPPAAFGHEMAGEISEIHPSVTGWSVGDRVVAANSAPCGACRCCLAGQENLCDDLLFLNGAYAESIVIPARIVEKNLVRLSGTTEFPHAALTEPLACVVQGVEDLQLKKREKVLVLGSGPIGLMFVALARVRGCDVALAGRGEERLRAAERLGAAKTITVGTPPDWDRVKAGLPEPPDVVVEAVGQPDAWEAAIRLVRKGGRVNLFGGCPSGTGISVDTGLMHYSSLTLLASFHHTPRTIRSALELIESRAVPAEQFISGCRPLAELPELFQSMARGNRAVKTWIQTGG